MDLPVAIGSEKNSEVQNSSKLKMFPRVGFRKLSRQLFMLSLVRKGYNRSIYANSVSEQSEKCFSGHLLKRGFGFFPGLVFVFLR